MYDVAAAPLGRGPSFPGGEVGPGPPPVGVGGTGPRVKVLFGYTGHAVTYTVTSTISFICSRRRTTYQCYPVAAAMGSLELLSAVRPLAPVLGLCRLSCMSTHLHSVLGLCRLLKRLIPLGPELGW